jgi:hypothetical protein
MAVVMLIQKLKMPAGGFLATHSMFDVGSDGYYWTSDE